MIGKIIGLIEDKAPSSVLINCQGVCYELEVPISTSFNLGSVGENASLFTHFVVREDAQLLYGFLDKKDRDIFRVLIKVNGVGPKLAITILSGLDSAALSQCVVNDDVAAFVKLPGIGKKTAERLLIELRDKVKEFVAGSEGSLAMPLTSVSAEESIKEEASQALIALGYKPQDADKFVKKVYAEDKSLEQVIKDALKQIL